MDDFRNNPTRLRRGEPGAERMRLVAGQDIYISADNETGIRIDVIMNVWDFDIKNVFVTCEPAIASPQAYSLFHAGQVARPPRPERAVNLRIAPIPPLRAERRPATGDIRRAAHLGGIVFDDHSSFRIRHFNVSRFRHAKNQGDAILRSMGYERKNRASSWQGAALPYASFSARDWGAPHLYHLHHPVNSAAFCARNFLVSGPPLYTRRHSGASRSSSLLVRRPRAAGTIETLRGTGSSVSFGFSDGHKP